MACDKDRPLAADERWAIYYGNGELGIVGISGDSKASLEKNLWAGDTVRRVRIVPVESENET